MRYALINAHPLVQQHEHLAALAVASRLENQGHTIDDEVTKHRYAFNRFGHLVSVRPMANVEDYSTRPWGEFNPPKSFTQLS